MTNISTIFFLLIMGWLLQPGAGAAQQLVPDLPLVGDGVISHLQPLYPVSPAGIAKHTEIILPKKIAKNSFKKIKDSMYAADKKNGKIPFVIILESSGGGDNALNKQGKYDRNTDSFTPWSEWFLENGVAVIQVHSAKARGFTNWEGDEDVGCDAYRQDAAMAYQFAIKKEQKLDPDRFALVGFSMGGRQALNSYPFFKDKKPSAIFSFYNACVRFQPEEDQKMVDWCPITYPPRSTMQIHILYGDEDAFGKVANGRGETTFLTCKKKADENTDGNIYFHGLRGALHSFENEADVIDDGDGTPPIPYGHNKSSRAAIKRSSDIIAKSLSKLWRVNIRRDNIDVDHGAPDR